MVVLVFEAVRIVGLGLDLDDSLVLNLEQLYQSLFLFLHHLHGHITRYLDQTSNVSFFRPHLVDPHGHHSITELPDDFDLADNAKLHLFVVDLGEKDVILSQDDKLRDISGLMYLHYSFRKDVDEFGRETVIFFEHRLANSQIDGGEPTTKVLLTF